MHFVVFSAIGVPGNLMTILVLVYLKNLRSKLVNIFIINQSAIDALVCLVKLLGQVICGKLLNSFSLKENLKKMNVTDECTCDCH